MPSSTGSQDVALPQVHNLSVPEHVRAQASQLCHALPLHCIAVLDVGILLALQLLHILPGKLLNQDGITVLQGGGVQARDAALMCHLGQLPPWWLMW